MTDASSLAPKRVRDVRLDFFRGIGMFIIFIAHVPNNAWAKWIPARFGFSDATEIFVFCSGMASAIAFGKVFDNRGWFLGAARIVFRCWQVYWAHIGIFFAILGVLIGVDWFLSTNGRYVGQLNLVPFVDRDTRTNLLGLLTLTYVPNYFDILPMYLIILVLVPVVMALSRLGSWAVFVFVIGLWGLANQGYFQFPSEPWSQRVWFFHPLAWQLVFFTGFAFIRGWLPAPPRDTRLIILAALILITSYPIAHYPTFQTLGVPQEWASWISTNMNKTRFGILRYVHFLALAYLAWIAAGPNGRNLTSGLFVDVCRKVGQQALAVFMAGLMLSFLGGVALDLLGRSFFSLLLVNLTGFAGLIITAYVVAWFKSGPWRGPMDQPSEATARVGGRVPQSV